MSASRWTMGTQRTRMTRKASAFLTAVLGLGLAACGGGAKGGGTMAGGGGGGPKSKKPMSKLAKDAPPPPEVKAPAKVAEVSQSEKAKWDKAAKEYADIAKQADAAGWTDGLCLQAAAIWKVSANASPKLVEARFNVGAAWSNCHADSKAEKEYNAALSIQAYAPALANIGEIYLRGHNESRAKEWFDKALQVDPNNAAAHNNLAWMIYEKMHVSTGRRRARSSGGRGHRPPAPRPRGGGREPGGVQYLRADPPRRLGGEPVASRPVPTAHRPGQEEERQVRAAVRHFGAALPQEERRLASHRRPDQGHRPGSRLDRGPHGPRLARRVVPQVRRCQGSVRRGPQEGAQEPTPRSGSGSPCAASRPCRRTRTCWTPPRRPISRPRAGSRTTARPTSTSA